MLERNLVILLLLVLLLPGCGLDQTAEPAAEEATETPVQEPDAAGVQIRVSNNSEVDFDAVEVGFPEQTVQYGSLPAGAQSDYHAVGKAYSYAYLKVTAVGEIYELQPVDYVGEARLPAGEYTYELDLQEGELALGLIADDPLMMDAQRYAQEQGISLQEALERLQAQDEIGFLGAQLESRERDTFAGLWIQHEPQYRVIVAFTRDGEATIQPYVAGSPLAELIEVRTAERTLEELKTTQEEVNTAVGETGIPIASGINIQENQVEVYVTDRAMFDAALEENDVELPGHVAVITTYEPLGDDPPFAVTPDPSIYFPQLKVRSPAFMEALLPGTLVVEDGCLRVRPEHGDGDETILVVWQPDYFLNNNDGTIEMLNREGQVVAHVGEAVSMGGGQVPAASITGDQLREPIPERCSDGEDYWLMGELVP